MNLYFSLLCDLICSTTCRLENMVICFLKDILASGLYTCLCLIYFTRRCSLVRSLQGSCTWICKSCEGLKRKRLWGPSGESRRHRRDWTRREISGPGIPNVEVFPQWETRRVWRWKNGSRNCQLAEEENGPSGSPAGRCCCCKGPCWERRTACSWIL